MYLSQDVRLCQVLALRKHLAADGFKARPAPRGQGASPPPGAGPAAVAAGAALFLARALQPGAPCPGLQVSVNDVVIKAAALALAAVPEVNVRWVRPGWGFCERDPACSACWVHGPGCSTAHDSCLRRGVGCERDVGGAVRRH